MIDGYHRSVSPCDMPCTSSTAGSLSETGETGNEETRWQPCTSKQWLKDSSGHPESSEDRGITTLPNEAVVKILSKLDRKTISVCRLVNRRWKALIDEHHLQALAFSRGLHHQPIKTDYHSSTRDWLTGFGDERRQLAQRLDRHLENKYFPEVLFFAIAEVLATTKLLTCQEVFIALHKRSVNNASFSPDGQHLVTVSDDKTAKIWGRVNGKWQEKATIEHSCRVMNVSFSPDGQNLLTTSWDNTGKIWGPVDGKWQEKAKIQHNQGAVGNASFSPDGQHLVTASKDNTVKIWRFVNGEWQEQVEIKHGRNWVKNVSFSPDGNHLLTVSGRNLSTVSDDNTVKVWRFVDGEWQEQVEIKHEDWVRSASFSPDGQHLVTASSDNTGQIWTLVNDQWQKKATIEHSCVVIEASFSPDGQHLVTASGDATAQIWGLVNGQWKKKATIKHGDLGVTNASFSPDGHHVVTVASGNAKIWEPAGDEYQEKATIQLNGQEVRNASFSPDGHHIVTVSRDTATIWLLKGREADCPNNNRDRAEPHDSATPTAPATRIM